MKAIGPVCEKYGIKMAIHPDDPAWPVFGLPRIITGKSAILKLLKAVDKEYNGITLCMGSLGTNPDNDIPDIIRSCIVFLLVFLKKQLTFLQTAVLICMKPVKLFTILVLQVLYAPTTEGQFGAKSVCRGTAFMTGLLVHVTFRGFGRQLKNLTGNKGFLAV